MGKVMTVSATKIEMKFRDEIGDLASGLKAHHDKLLSYARNLESIISDHSAELEQTKEQIIQLNTAKEELERQVDELSRRNREITLFSKMNDFMQSSNTVYEAYSIISETVRQLFPEDSGAVFVLNASRDILEAVVEWGQLPPANKSFSPNECWAYRRGQVHIANAHEQWCPHVIDDGHMCACLPLLAQGESLGILHLHSKQNIKNKTDDSHMDEKCSLARILADNIGLGIANLRLRESMRNLSIRDPLTGLFNRRYMEEALAQEQQRILRIDGQLAVIMIDIDHFKEFNDKFGHDGGDAILRTLGIFFRKHVRGGDVACRYGGEEFILVLSPSTAVGALQQAEKIREDAMALNVTHASRDLGPITLSLGIAILPDHASEPEAIIKAADVALYKAKQNGRNHVVMFKDKAGQIESRHS